MTFGDRLREERERLEMSQPKFAAIADTTKQTLFSWESGKTAPDAVQLSALATVGVDVLYVITGQRSTPVPRTAELPPRIRALVANYEAAPEEGKRHIEGAASLASQAAKKGRAA